MPSFFRSLSPEISVDVLTAILVNAVDGMIVIDGDGIIQSFNPASEAIFGYTAKETIGQNVSMLMPSETAREHDGYLDRYERTLEARIIGIGREVNGQRKNGEIFPLELSVSRFEIKNQVFYSGILRDISLRRQAEERIAQTTAELERFAYIASHDLKEPLRTIESFADILQADFAAQLPPDAQEYLGYISGAAGQLREMIADILDYSKLDAEYQGFDVFSAEEKVQIALQNLSEAIRDAGADVQVTSELPVVRAHPIRFVRVIHNLVGNSIKYRKSDHPLEIRISADVQNDKAIIAVADNGIGIPPEYQKQVFEMFKRLHARSEYSGNGIGLAICHKIVASWGGRIWVESQPGVGSQFKFTVPLA